jgi:hypothetical protein
LSSRPYVAELEGAPEKYRRLVLTLNNELLVLAKQGDSPWIIEGTVDCVQSGVWNINDITGTVSLPTGAATLAAQTTGNLSLSEILNEIKSSSGTVAAVAASTSAQTVLASNSLRRGFFLFNDTNKDAFIKLAAAPTTASFSFKISPGGLYERDLTNYKGIVTAIWASSASGNLLATELA